MGQCWRLMVAHVDFNKFTICDQLVTAIITINNAGQGSHIGISWVSKWGSVRVIADRIVGIISQTASGMIWYRVVIAACQRMLWRMHIHKCCVVNMLRLRALLLQNLIFAELWLAASAATVRVCCCGSSYFSVCYWWVHLLVHKGMLESAVSVMSIFISFPSGISHPLQL
jgi:hypothetical protein